jgi:hypothetical protein
VELLDWLRQGAMRIQLQEDAAQQVEKYADKFSKLLIVQAKLEAYRRKDSLVLPICVDRSWEVLTERPKPSRVRRFVGLLGSAFFGAFVKNSITQLNSGSLTLELPWVALALVSIPMIIVSLA